MNISTFAEATESTVAKPFSFAGLWEDIVTFFTTKYWNIILFFLILIVGIILIKSFAAILRRIFNRGKMEKIAQSFILKVVKFTLYLVLILILLSVMGVQISGIITALSAAVLAIGMALKDNIANLASGIIVVSGKMISKGDFISVDGKEGTVFDINFLFTTINTPDNKKIHIPNGKLTANPLTNYGANGSRRVDFTFSVAYETDVEQVKSIVLSVMESCDKVATTPAPFCRLKVLNSSSLDFFANCWCKSADYWDVYYFVMENVFNEFKKHGISIPFAQSEVRIRTDEVAMPVNNLTLKRTAPEFAIESEKEKDEFEFIKKASEKTRKKVNERKKKKAAVIETPEATNNE